MMYIGKEAEDILTDILGNKEGDRYPKHKGATGYFLDESGVYVAFDNTTCDCFVDDFATKESAINWIKNGHIQW